MRDVFERRIHFPADFPMLGEVVDIVPMDSRDFRYRYSPLRLLLAGIDPSTLPMELVGPLCGFVKMKVYLSRLIRCCLTAP